MHKRRRNTLVSSASVLFLCALRREEPARGMQRFVEIFANKGGGRIKPKDNVRAAGTYRTARGWMVGGACVSELATSDGEIVETRPRVHAVSEAPC